MNFIRPNVRIKIEHNCEKMWKSFQIFNRFISSILKSVLWMKREIFMSPKFFIKLTAIIGIANTSTIKSIELQHLLVAMQFDRQMDSNSRTIQKSATKSNESNQFYFLFTWLSWLICKPFPSSAVWQSVLIVSSYHAPTMTWLPSNKLPALVLLDPTPNRPHDWMLIFWWRVQGEPWHRLPPHWPMHRNCVRSW